MRRNAWYLVLVASIALTGSRALAQERATFALQLGRGWGDGSGGDFVASHSEGVEVGISLRVPTFARKLAGVAQVEFDGRSDNQNSIRICSISATSSSCVSTFPHFAGSSLAGGIMFTPHPRIELRAVAGPGLYAANNGTVLGIMGGVDAAVFPLNWLGVAGGWKHVVIPDYLGQRLQVARGFVGVRVRVPRSARERSR